MKGKYLQKFIPLLFIMITAFGCAEMPVYKIVSEDEQKDYYQGREIVARNDDIAKTTLEIDGQSENNYVFYLTVTNNSSESLSVHPEDIYLELLDEEKQPVFINGQNTVYALDPETRINEINSDIKSRDTWHGFATGINIITAFVDVASALSDDYDHKGERVGNSIANGVDAQLNENSNYEYDIDNMKSDKNFWQNEALRITDLQPGETIGGLVFVPEHNEIKYMRLCIPLDSVEHVYLLKTIRVN